MFSLPRSHVSNKGGMFGARGGVGGAATTHALRRPHAGAETREELEQLPDDVLSVIVDAARAKIKKDERRARQAEADRLAELEDRMVDSDEEDGVGKSQVPKPDPVAETVLHMGDGDDDALDALRGLGEKQALDEILQRGDLARSILAARLARRAGARRRRCVSISRVFHDRHAHDATAHASIIHPTDFELFVHRGLDCEKLDAREIARLYACCLSGRPGSRAAASDSLDAEQLLRVLDSGRWRRHWSRYVRDARRRALDVGVCSASLCVFGATARDPFADTVSDAKYMKRNGQGGYPDSAFLGAFAELAGVNRYVNLCAACLTLPVFGFVATSQTRGVFRTHALVAHAARFALPATLQKQSGVISLMAPILFSALFWSIATTSVLLYTLRQPEHLLVDILVPIGWTVFLVSMLASCLASALNAGAAGPAEFGNEAQWKQSHTFPGGPAVLPDDTVAVAQSNPKETRSNNFGGEFTSWKGKKKFEKSWSEHTGEDTFDRGDAHATHTGFTSRDELAVASTGVDSARGNGGFGSFGAARLASHANGESTREDDKNKRARTGRETMDEQQALYDDGNELDGNSRPGRRSTRGRRGFAAAGRGLRHDNSFESKGQTGSVSQRAAYANHPEEQPKQFTPVTEKDIADAVTRRATEETNALSKRGGALGAYLGSSPLALRHKFVFLVAAACIAAVPAAHRAATGVAVFGGADSVFVCVDSVLPDAVSTLLGLAKCSSVVTNTTVTEYDHTETEDYSPSLTSAEDAISVETDSGDLNSATGATIVSAATVWTVSGVYMALTATRWVTARAHAHYVRLRIFAAVTDPSAACSADVPFLNLRKASLPWLRLRAHFHRLRALELEWARVVCVHLFVATLVGTVASAVCATRKYTSPTTYGSSNSAAAAFAVCAFVFSAQLAVLRRVTRAIESTQSDDATIVRREIWKISVDAEDMDRVGVGDRDGGDVNGVGGVGGGSMSPQRARRVRQFENERDRLNALRDEIEPAGLNRASHGVNSADVSFFVSVALFVGVVGFFAVDLTATAPYQGMTVDTLNVNVDANFAVVHAAHEFLAQRITRLAQNVTNVMALVEQTSGLVAVVDNNSARQSLEAVNALTESLQGVGCVT